MSPPPPPSPAAGGEGPRFRGRAVDAAVPGHEGRAWRCRRRRRPRGIVRQRRRRRSNEGGRCKSCGLLCWRYQGSRPRRACTTHGAAAPRGKATHTCIVIAVCQLAAIEQLINRLILPHNRLQPRGGGRQGARGRDEWRGAACCKACKAAGCRLARTASQPTEIARSTRASATAHGCPAMHLTRPSWPPVRPACRSATVVGSWVRALPPASCASAGSAAAAGRSEKAGLQMSGSS